MLGPDELSSYPQVPSDWELLTWCQLLAAEPTHPPADIIIPVIEEAADKSDILLLALLARAPGGLQTTLLRARAWPLLVGQVSDESTDESLLQTLQLNDREPHKDEEQVSLDIKRLFTIASHVNFFNHEINSSYTTILSPEDSELLRKRLYCLVVKLLRKYPCLNYYQGFHDIASVVLLVCNDLNDHDDQAFVLLENLAIYYLRDYMNPHMGLSINHLKLIPLILEKADPSLFQLIRQTSASYSSTYGAFYDYKFYPALLVTLTMYSHDINNFQHMMLIWDFILGSGSISTSAFIYVAFVLHFKSKIMDELGIIDLAGLDIADADEIHKSFSPLSLFSSLTDLDVAKVLTMTSSLMEQWPLDALFSTNELSRLWFKEFNTDSAVVAPSLITSSARRLLPWDLKLLVERQERQQLQESTFDSDLYLKAIEQDLLASSINSLEEDSAEALSLSIFDSSLSNLSAVSLSINTCILTTSSAILKKFYHYSDDEMSDEDARRDRFSSLYRSIYKISFTIGLIGFLLHFLVKHSDVSQGYSGKVFFSILQRASSIWGQENPLVAHASRAMGDLVNSFQDSELANIGRYVSEVGLASVRKTVFAFEQIY